MRATETRSSAACSPSPTEPSPSSVAVNRLVKFPSDPPPTLAASSGMPRRRPISWARRKSARLRAVGSIGDLPKAPSTRIRASGSTGCSERMAASTSTADASVGTRTSTSAIASGAITFAHKPPSIVPTFTVIPRAGSLSWKSRWIWWDSSRMADRPSSGATQACAARPVTVTRKCPTPLRAVLSFPAGPKPGSSTNARAALRVSLRSWRSESRLPISSSLATCTTGVSSGSSPNASRARSANTICASPPFMS